MARSDAGITRPHRNGAACVSNDAERVTAELADATADGRPRELLAVERRLQDLVRAAEAAAASRIAAARAAGEQRLAAARYAAQQANDAHAREERRAHEETLAAIESAHQAALASIVNLSDRHVDELARWALDQVIRPGGGAA